MNAPTVSASASNHGSNTANLRVMTTGATTATADAAEGEPRTRAEAGPLPLKAGEIGAEENGVVGGLESRTDASTTRDPDERRRSTLDPTLSPSRRRPRSRGTLLSHPPAPSSPAVPPLSPSSSTKASKWAFTFHGIRSSTLLRLAIIFTVLTGTIIAWALVIHFRGLTSPSDNDSSSNSGSNSNKNQGLSASQSQMFVTVFIYITFFITLLFQVIIFERTIFLARAERFAYLHPESLSAASPGDAVMGFAPWNRPHLPTYASALGFRGTGDVEDEAIARPPPPAYGNTRDSTLLLLGSLPENMQDWNRDSHIEQGRVSDDGSHRLSRVSDAAGGHEASGTPLMSSRSRSLREVIASRPVESALSPPAPAVLRH
ncbi:hypothetical protein BOTBODRAFT_54943 [Botryobasidium botryosum FD-172 SS1]|uniref:Uncharacterized protein n=1 Tax=Botryobasidium botryosum (strain FD-172 SS1) TaxID=930990 RepID=A0A067MK18_BOTB1|nr:hypothetical protein BOTBODRAFT_54943 [Botryobasidium botryosum FD-172 SS1]